MENDEEVRFQRAGNPHILCSINHMLLIFLQQNSAALCSHSVIHRVVGEGGGVVEPSRRPPHATLASHTAADTGDAAQPAPPHGMRFMATCRRFRASLLRLI